MKQIPIYFPMTYLSSSGLRILSACFGQVAVCRPSDRELPENMQAAVDQGRLVVLTPVADESDRLGELMKAYYTWARENKGVDLALYRGRESHIPFFEESSISSIRQSIRNMDGEGNDTAAVDQVLEARLFLEMAQELDCQNEDLEQSLDEVRVKESSMLADLLGDADGHPAVGKVSAAIPVADQGTYLTDRRLEAWGRLFQAGDVPGRLLVTDSRAVIEHLVEQCPDLERLEQTLALPLPVSDSQSPAWQEPLREYLLRMADTPAVGDFPPEVPNAKPEEAAIQLTFLRCAQTDTGTLFSGQSAPDDTGKASESGDNLLVCLVVVVDGQPH